MLQSKLLSLCAVVMLTAMTLMPTTTNGAPRLTFELLEKQAHDPLSYTQGLVYEKGRLYESSGLYGKSFIAVYPANAPEKATKQGLTKEIFAEGLAKVGNELFLLTWRKGILFRLDANTLKIKRTMRYTGEGWGLTPLGKQLVMSNGSHQLSFRDPQSFNETRRINVIEDQKRIDKLNELEYDGKHLWANRWQTPFIYQIDPESGKVLAKLDLSSLQPSTVQNKQAGTPKPEVLNGIAYVPEKNAFWITGKFWPQRYLIRIQNPKPNSEK